MTTITTRRLDKNTYVKAENFLRQVEEFITNDMCCYGLFLKSGAEDGLYLDALLQLQSNKISIKTIWACRYDPKLGMLSARNQDGERGSYAKILGEKYFNRFLEYIDTVDIDNVKQRRYSLTPQQAR